MKQMYVITRSQGSYEDFSMSVVAVTDDMEKGQAYVNRMNAILATLNVKVSAFQANELKEWHVFHPRPEHRVTTGLKSIPKWRGDQPVTQAMREQRRELQDYNAKLAEKAAEPVRAWANELKAFEDSWFAQHLTEDEKKLTAQMGRYPDVNGWEIEAVSWL